MQITHVERTGRGQLSGQAEAFLVDDLWDDYAFKTLFELVVFSDDGQRFDVGNVKILSRGLTGGRVEIPRRFDALSSNYCSLGQGESYYEALMGLPGNFGDQVLSALRDCVTSPEIYAAFREERGFRTSLLRSVPEEAITTSFVAALGGQAPLTEFHFEYAFPEISEDLAPPTAGFQINPQSMPPSNVHAVIGRNGVGKTRLLGNIAAAICQARGDSDPTIGSVSFLSAEGGESFYRFANLVAVTFSAFDPFRAPPQDAMTTGDMRYEYVGLKRPPAPTRRPRSPQPPEVKDHEDLVREFQESLQKCRIGPRLQRWREAIQTLETDPGIQALELRELLPDATDQNVQAVVERFRALSSGHKITLLIMTKLVQLVDEKTLVLFDEPEAHLHPPLLSSLVRALSTLLRRRNGAAIIATHSPVVLQEVPSNCVWVLRREGDAVAISRPTIETFAENVGVLTREVFGLEVTASGFHQLIAREAEGFFTTYEAVVQSFKGQLGAEGRAIARGLTRRDG